MSDYGELVLAYGESDEYSFVLSRHSQLYGRRPSKIQTSFVSLFAASFVFLWPKFFPTTPLRYPPCFDARTVCYPSLRNIRDYLAWRQADTHINCLYNTTFWCMVQGGKSAQEAEAALKGTLSADKNEILFQNHGINYNDLPLVFRKGTTLTRLFVVEEGSGGSTSDAGGSGGHGGTKEELKEDGLPAGSATATSLPSPPNASDTAMAVRGTATGLETLRFPSTKDIEKATKRMSEGRMARIKGAKKPLVECYCDIISEDFWTKFPYILV